MTGNDIFASEQKQTTVSDRTTDGSVITDSTEDSFSKGRKKWRVQRRYGRRTVRNTVPKEIQVDYDPDENNKVPDVAPSSRDVSRAILEGNPSHDRRLRQYIQGLERGRKKVEVDIFLHQRQFLLKQLFNKDLEIKYKRRAYHGVESDGEGTEDTDASPGQLSELPRLQRPQTPVNGHRVPACHRRRLRYSHAQEGNQTSPSEPPANETRPLTQEAVAEHTLAHRLTEHGNVNHFPTLSHHDKARQETAEDSVRDSFAQKYCSQEDSNQNPSTEQPLQPEERYVELDDSDPSTFLIKKLLCCDVEDNATPRENDVELETILSSSYDVTEQQSMEVKGTAIAGESGFTEQRRTLSRKKSSLTDGASSRDNIPPYGTLGGCRMPRIVRREERTAAFEPAESAASPPERLPHLSRSAFVSQKSFSSPNLLRSHPVSLEERRGFGSHPAIVHTEAEPQSSLARSKDQIIEKLALSLPVHLLTKAMEDKDQRILTLSWKDTHDKQKRLLAKTKKTLYENHLRDPRFVKLQESLCTIETPPTE
ncbi:Hypp6464 [Branchiostoma lanceolatum]|uniref:Hypp6464 protein n=1 Tax=Branchiostoma lanceolatum TaxID=7740 RepID=A0A8K0E6U1_BRALA|nr:Hypp6464 [Branchiostoma lanceolatum]